MVTNEKSRNTELTEIEIEADLNSAPKQAMRAVHSWIAGSLL